MNLFRPFQIYLEWRAKRDEALAKEFEQIDADVRAAGMRLGEVVWVRKYYPRKGTKAQLEWLDTGESTAVWIDHRPLNPRDIVAASGKLGWGPHHDEEVFFIGRCVGHFMSRRTYKGWLRHNARIEQAAGKVRRSRYTYAVEGEFVFIIDVGHRSNPSVTNDAELVIKDLTERGIDVDRHVVLYQDSAGTWDQMTTRDSRFVGFVIIGDTNKDRAAAIAVDKRNRERARKL